MDELSTADEQNAAGDRDEPDTRDDPLDSAGLSPWSLLAVLAVFAIGIVLIMNWYWRRGSVVIGGSVALAGVLRLVLPPKWVGLLKVRSRGFDATLLLGMGVAIMVLGMTVPGVYEP
ncbi:DUF3017 domain-containing protein [Brooklawnia sp.]|uniref:DUF3017 domain-containing protein n=1 Tax=Brooklawnia sp. TaxID=2699740 RepID=UPI00311D3462